MQLSHIRKVVSATFDDPNLVSVAGLVPVMKLAADSGLHELADRHLTGLPQLMGTRLTEKWV